MRPAGRKHLSPAQRGRREAPGEGVAPSPDKSAAPHPDPLLLGERGLVQLGEFGRAHGLKGEVRLKSATADPLAIATYGPLVGADGRTYWLEAVRPVPGAAPDLLVARVEGVTAREGAERLNRVALMVARDRLPPPEDEDEFLAADLVGARVEDPGGETLGTIVAVVDYGSGDLLEIKGPGRRSVLLPFTKAFVPVVDVAAGRVVADPPAGLLDEES